MSAECSKCGSDLTYPAGSWPVGTCEPCELKATIKRLAVEARTYAGNVRRRAVRSPERIAAFIEELADVLEAENGQASPQ